MFYSHQTSAWLQQIPKYVYRRTRTNPCRRDLYSLDVEISANGSPGADIYGVRAHIHTRLGRLTFRRHVRLIYVCARSRRFVRQVPGAIYVRLVDARYTRGIGQSRGGWDLLSLRFACGERGRLSRSDCYTPLLPQRLAKFIISRCVEDSVISTVVFYAGIVKQFFADYPLHNRVPEYLDDRRWSSEFNNIIS